MLQINAFKKKEFDEIVKQCIFREDNKLQMITKKF